MTGCFAQSEDIVVSLFIPYCESGAEWEVVIDGDAPERCPDLVPFPATEGDVNRVRYTCSKYGRLGYLFVCVEKRIHRGRVFFYFSGLFSWGSGCQEVTHVHMRRFHFACVEE